MFNDYDELTLLCSSIFDKDKSKEFIKRLKKEYDFIKVITIDWKVIGINGYESKDRIYCKIIYKNLKGNFKNGKMIILNKTFEFHSVRTVPRPGIERMDIATAQRRLGGIF